VNWLPLKNDAVLLQIFPKDNRWAPIEVKQKMRDCVAHAREEGLWSVGVTYQTYADAQPEWYDVASFAHSTFPGNLIAHGDWPKWYA
jgi:hypothetical protein